MKRLYLILFSILLIILLLCSCGDESSVESSFHSESETYEATKSTVTDTVSNVSEAESATEEETPRETLETLETYEETDKETSETVTETDAKDPTPLPTPPVGEYTEPAEVTTAQAAATPEVSKVSSTAPSVTSAPQVVTRETEAPVTARPIIPSPPASIQKFSFDENTFIETILLDERSVRITAVSMKQEFSTLKLELLIENNTDKDLTFSSDSLIYSCNSVNGYMVNGGYLNTTVLAGKKDYETVSFYADELEELAVFTIAEMELSFRITDVDRSVYLLSSPRKIRTTLADSYNINDNTYQKALQDPAYIKSQNIEVLYFTNERFDSDPILPGLSYAFIKDDQNRTHVVAEFANSTSEVQTFNVNNLYVNGLKVFNGSYYSYSVSPNCRVVVKISISGYFGANMMSAVGLVSYADIGFDLSLYNADGSTANTSRVVLCDKNAAYTAPDLTGTVLYEANGVKLTYCSVIETENEYRDDLDLVLFVENNSGKDIRADMKFGETSINGFMVQPHNSLSIVPNGECAVITSRFYENELEPLKISSPADIKTMEMTFVVKDTSFNEIISEKICISK